MERANFAARSRAADGLQTLIFSFGRGSCTRTPQHPVERCLHLESLLEHWPQRCRVPRELLQGGLKSSEVCVVVHEERLLPEAALQLNSLSFSLDARSNCVSCNDDSSFAAARARSHSDGFSCARVYSIKFCMHFLASFRLFCLAPLT